MKNFLLTILLIISPIFILFPEELSVLQTGDLLHIQPSEPCMIYLDGIELGIAPLFISNISDNNKLIQLRGKSRYAEVKLQYNPLKTGVSFYKPVLGEYYGMMAFDCNIKEVVLLIDGEPHDFTEEWLIKLSSGKHSISIHKNGFLPVSEDIEIPRLESIELNINLIPAEKISFSERIPEDSIIKFRQSETELEFSDIEQDEIYLSRGIWECSVENKLFETMKTIVTVENHPITIDSTVNFYSPKLRITDIGKDSKIFLNEENVTDIITNGIVPIPIGTSELLILNKKYLPFSMEIMAEDGNIIDASPDYKPDPNYTKTVKITIGTIIAGAGAGILTGGLLLSNNNFLSEASSNYTTYKALKYSTLGTAAAGLILFIGGVTFDCFSIFSD